MVLSPQKFGVCRAYNIGYENFEIPSPHFRFEEAQVKSVNDIRVPGNYDYFPNSNLLLHQLKVQLSN
jgi:hypothetical protein